MVKTQEKMVGIFESSIGHTPSEHLRAVPRCAQMGWFSQTLEDDRDTHELTSGMRLASLMNGKVWSTLTKLV